MMAGWLSNLSWLASRRHNNGSRSWTSQALGQVTRKGRAKETQIAWPRSRDEDWLPDVASVALPHCRVTAASSGAPGRVPRKGYCRRARSLKPRSHEEDRAGCPVGVDQTVGATKKERKPRGRSMQRT